MARTGCLLLVLALTGPGCLSSGTHVEAESRKTAPLHMTEAPPAVTPDQVNEANAADQAQALAREMDYEAGIRRNPSETTTSITNLMIP
jgi:hypothetical protein